MAACRGYEAWRPFYLFSSNEVALSREVGEQTAVRSILHDEKEDSRHH